MCLFTRNSASQKASKNQSPIFLSLQTENWKARLNHHHHSSISIKLLFKQADTKARLLDKSIETKDPHKIFLITHSSSTGFTWWRLSWWEIYYETWQALLYTRFSKKISSKMYTHRKSLNNYNLKYFLCSQSIWTRQRKRPQNPQPDYPVMIYISAK